MALTYPLTAPTSPAPRTFDLIYDSGASVSASPFTTQVQTFEHERLHWSAAVTLPPMKDDPDGRKWHGFLISLRGKVGTFYMTPPDHATPSGTERNNFQLASTALIRADEISVQSMTPGATMLVGDLMQISNRLYMVAEGHDRRRIWNRHDKANAWNAGAIERLDECRHSEPERKVAVVK